MDFQAAIRKIEERGDFNRYAEVKSIFEDELKVLKRDDYTERGLCYYYLLVSYLKAQLVHETEESKDYYEAMDKAFLKQENTYLVNPKKFSPEEVKDFYRLMERCYNSLEFLYQKHAFKTRRNEAYQQKMCFRKNSFWFNKEFGGWLEYQFLNVTCRYGTSLLHWSVTTFVFIILMAFIYMAVDESVTSSLRMVPENGHWYDYIYFSVIVTTTVGLGDVFPLTFIGKILVSIEAFVGFLMLGIFIGLIQKKL